MWASIHAGGSRAINSVGECYLHTVEVTGSSPVSPTIFIEPLALTGGGFVVGIAAELLGAMLDLNAQSRPDRWEGMR
jgi:hypothetical protein